MQDHFSSSSSTEEKQEETKKEKTRSHSFLTLDDLKQRNIDINPKTSAFEALCRVAEVALDKFNREKGENQKLERLLTEKSLKKPVESYSNKQSSTTSSQEFSGEKFLPSSATSCQKTLNEREIGDSCKRPRPQFRPVDVIENLEEDYLKPNKKSKSNSVEKENEDDQWNVIRKNQKRKRNGSRKEQLKPDKPRLKKKVPVLPNPPPELSQEFKNKISELGGRDLVLVTQKVLFATDIDDNHCRLLIPKSGIKAKFLTEEEEKELEMNMKGKRKESMAVKIIDPSLQEVKMNFNQWNMKKDNGKCSQPYVFQTHWNALKNANNLKEMDMVQIWSFRIGKELWFALVKINGGANQNVAEEGSDNNDGSACACTGLESGKIGNNSGSRGTTSSSPRREAEDESDDRNGGGKGASLLHPWGRFISL